MMFCIHWFRENHEYVMPIDEKKLSKNASVLYIISKLNQVS